MLGASKSFAFKSITNKNRFLFELSSMETKEPARLLRQRYRLQNAIIFPLPKFKHKTSLNYCASNEILIKTVKDNTTLDQNRLYDCILLEKQASDISLGYQYTFQKEGNAHISKNQLLLTLNLNL